MLAYLCIFFQIYVWFISEDEQFEADKAQVVKEIAALEPRDGP